MEPEIKFEDALRQLEGTVEALESGELGLDDALARYEQGIRLLSRCRALLDNAERKVALLTGIDDQGQPETTTFDASATLEPDPPAKPSRTRKPRIAPERETDPRSAANRDDPPW
jgi:exodeoxyribonuclease VII small subunit